MSTHDDIPNIELMKKGRMKKHPVHMSPEELEAWEKEETIRIREYLFSIGYLLVILFNNLYLIVFLPAVSLKSSIDISTLWLMYFR